MLLFLLLLNEEIQKISVNIDQRLVHHLLFNSRRNFAFNSARSFFLSQWFIHSSHRLIQLQKVIKIQRGWKLWKQWFAGIMRSLLFMSHKTIPKETIDIWNGPGRTESISLFHFDSHKHFNDKIFSNHSPTFLFASFFLFSETSVTFRIDFFLQSSAAKTFCHTQQTTTWNGSIDNSVSNSLIDIINILPPPLRNEAEHKKKVSLFINSLPRQAC